MTPCTGSFVKNESNSLSSSWELGAVKTWYGRFFSAKKLMTSLPTVIPLPCPEAGLIAIAHIRESLKVGWPGTSYLASYR